MTTKPVRRYNRGLVKMAVWENKKEFNGVEKIVPSYQITKSYKDKKGEWQNTNSLNIQELKDLAFLIFDVEKEETKIRQEKDSPAQSVSSKQKMLKG